MIARNEIYARHGRKFNDSELQAYFNSKSWYKGTVNPEDFSTSVFFKSDSTEGFGQQTDASVKKYEKTI